MRNSRDPQLVKQVEVAIDAINEVVGYDFLKATDDYKVSDIRIAFSKAAPDSRIAGQSEVGRFAETVSKEKPTLTYNYWENENGVAISSSAIWHELFHSLGFVHEFQSPQFNLYQLNNQSFWGDEKVFKKMLNDKVVDSKENWETNYKIYNYSNFVYSFYDPYSITNYQETEANSLSPIVPALQDRNRQMENGVYLSYLDTLALKYFYNPRYRRTKVKSSFIHFDIRGLKHNLGRSAFSDVDLLINKGVFKFYITFGHQAFVLKDAFLSWELIQNSLIYVNGIPVEKKLLNSDNKIFDFFLPGENEIIIKPQASISAEDFEVRLEFDELEYSFLEYVSAEPYIDQDSGYYYYSWLRGIANYGGEEDDLKKYSASSTEDEDLLFNFKNDLFAKLDRILYQDFDRYLHNLPFYSEENTQKKEEEVRTTYKKYEKINLLHTIYDFNGLDLLRFLVSDQFLKGGVVEYQKSYFDLFFMVEKKQFQDATSVILKIREDNGGLTDLDYFYFVGLLNHLIESDGDLEDATSYFAILAENLDWKRLLKASKRNIDGIMYFDVGEEFLALMYARYITDLASSIKAFDLCDDRGKCSYSKFLQALETKTASFWEKDEEFFKKIDIRTLLIEVFYKNPPLKIPFLEILANRVSINIAEYTDLFFFNLDNYWKIVLLEVLEVRSLMDFNHFAAAGFLGIREEMMIEDGKIVAENFKDYSYLRNIKNSNQDLQDAYVDWIKIGKQPGATIHKSLVNDYLKNLAKKYDNIDDIYENIVSKPCSNGFGKYPNWHYLRKEWFLPFSIHYQGERSMASRTVSHASPSLASDEKNRDLNYCRLEFDSSAEIFNYLVVTGAYRE